MHTPPTANLSSEEGLQPVAHDGALLRRQLVAPRRRLRLDADALLRAGGGEPGLEPEQLRLEAQHLSPAAARAGKPGRNGKPGRAGPPTRF